MKKNVLLSKGLWQPSWILGSGVKCPRIHSCYPPDIIIRDPNEEESIMKKTLSDHAGYKSVATRLKMAASIEHVIEAIVTAPVKDFSLIYTPEKIINCQFEQNILRNLMTGFYCLV